MARIRTIKPEFWTDPEIVSLPFVARLLFIGLWNYCDDEGYCMDEPKRIKMEIFPADDVDTVSLIQMLIDSGLVERIETENEKPILCVKNFLKHQRVSHPTKSTIKEGISGKLRSPRENSGGLRPERNGTERNRTERKGIDLVRTEAVRSIDSDLVFADEPPETKTRITEQAAKIHKRIYPNANGLKSQDKDEIIRACYLSDVLLTPDWLISAVDSTANKRADKPMAFFRSCLIGGAKSLGYDYHALIDRVILPKVKPREDTS